MKANLSLIQTRILPFIFGLALFGVAFMAVKGMMFGNTTNVKLVAALVVVVGIVLALDKNYWLLFPVSFIVGIKIPGLPFDGKELGGILLIVMYVIRLTLQKERMIKPHLTLSLCFPFLLWIFIVWCVNPTGMVIFGNTTIGARFYLKIVLSFLAACIMCTKIIDEKNAKKLFFAIVLAQLVQSLGSFFMKSFAVGNLEYESESRYQYLFAMYFYLLIFCRYSLSEIFKSGWKFFAICILALLTIYSGKRRAIGTLFILPILRVYFTGKDKLLTFICVFISLFFLMFAIACDGVFYDFPPSVKRSLSIVVPKYRKSEITQDIFRYEVRQFGNRLIEESPWFGRKGFAMDFRETAWAVARVHNNTGNLYEMHAHTGNWHSTWYAYACDFGLPCMILFIFPFVYSLIYSYKVIKRSRYGTWSFICVLYFSFYTYIFAIFSYTSGQSAASTELILFYLGMLVALDNGLKQAELQAPVEEIRSVY